MALKCEGAPSSISKKMEIVGLVSSEHDGHEEEKVHLLCCASEISGLCAIRHNLINPDNDR